MSDMLFVWLDHDAQPWGQGETANQALSSAVLAYSIAHQNDPAAAEISLDDYFRRGTYIQIHTSNLTLTRQWLNLEGVRSSTDLSEAQSDNDNCPSDTE